MKRETRTINSRFTHVIEMMKKNDIPIGDVDILSDRIIIRTSARAEEPSDGDPAWDVVLNGKGFDS